MADLLIFDVLLIRGGIRQPDMYYPPVDTSSLHRLLRAIDTSTYDTLKKDCLIYMLLKWYHDNREARFQVERCIPPQFVALADAYWHLDTGHKVDVRHSAVCVLNLGRHRSNRKQFPYFPTPASTEITSPRSCRHLLSTRTLRH